MKPSRLAATGLLVLVALAGVGVLSGCTPAVVMEAADDANNPECADVIVRLPQTLQGLERRETNAQATGAWGDPSSVLLRCGVEVPVAATLPCVLVDGIYWTNDDSQAPTLVFRTFGRDPAVDVVIDRDVVSPGPVLADLTRMIEFTSENGLECSDAQEAPAGQ
jgi:hypothetical protein